ncbi:MAG: DNA polymerase III subunit gamma/tau, partial [Sphingomonas sp.]|nr:DNA polymerase III subunit gamma/tau [Sphingomonas sp.]
LLGMLDAARESGLAETLRLTARVVRFEPRAIALSSSKPTPADLPRDLAESLKRITGQPWRVTIEDAPGAPTMREAQAAARAAELDRVKQAPIVKAALEAFPDAEIIDWNLQERSTS